MQISPGEKVGPYEILAPIGAGGMGEVWRARDARIGRDVAIKFIPEALRSPDRLHRFEQEARAAGSLNHPNLVTIHDLGVDDSVPYVVMELLDGETLRARLPGKGERLPVRKAVDYAVQIASGLAAAHEHGVVHRDLKPENIIVTRDGRVKIVDFGLAKLSGRTDGPKAEDSATQHRDTAPGTVLGTAGYMSPEQVRGLQVDHRSDIFSFGAILYEMLAGYRAFKGDSSIETMNSILKDEPPELASSDAHVPPALDAIVRHCLEKSPTERFQSARDLAFDLGRVSSLSGSGPALTVARRPRWIAPVLAALVVLAAVFAAWRLGQRNAIAGKASSPPMRRYTLLTNQAGMEMYPSLAPDGKTFVYVSSAAGNADIYLQRVDGRNAINLTKASGVDNTQPAFSPDGAQIAFRSERDGGGIFLMGATGESVRRLTDFGYSPSWSPDASEIAVSTALVDIAPYSRPTRSTVSVVNVRTGARRDIAGEAFEATSDAAQPSWSPHGDRIAYWAIAGNGGQRDIFTVDPHAAKPQQTMTRVTADAPLDWNPVWAPDGKSLYFSSDRDGTMNLWRVPVDEHAGKATGPPEPLALPTRFAAHFTFARDGQSMAYAGIDLSDTLWRVPFDPAALRVNGVPNAITGGAMLILASGTASPDGNWIAFTNVGTKEDLFIARADGSEMRQVTNDPEKDRGPSWSPDGKLIYFYSQRGDRYDIWSIRADGSGLRQVSRTRGLAVWWPKLMLGGRQLYVYNNLGTYLLQLETGGLSTRLEPLPPAPAGIHFTSPELSPDGARFAGAGDASSEDKGIWLYSLKTAAYEQIAARGTSPAWLPDGKHLLFQNVGKIQVLDVDTKQVRPVALPTTMRAFTAARDGRALYVAQRASESDIWLMAPPP